MKWSRIVLSQVIIAVVIALIAALLGGKEALISSALASASCVIPNSIMFAGFYINDSVLKRGTAAVFVLELVKIILTVALVIAVFWFYKDVNWIAFIFSYVIALKSYIFVLSRSKN